MSIAVEVYSAVESQAEITFNQIDRFFGGRVNMQRIVQGVPRSLAPGYFVRSTSSMRLPNTLPRFWSRPS